MLVMGLVLGPSLMLISIMGIICKSISPLYCITGVHCLHVIYIVYKHFDRSLQIGSSDPTCAQNFRLISHTLFGIQTEEQEQEEEELEKWTFCHISYVSGRILSTF